VVRRFIVLALLLAAAVSLWAPELRAQCAMCVTALENSPEGKAMAASFNNGILFLLAMPYAIFGTIGFVVFRAYRRKKAEARRNNPYLPKA
jgi:hypothetical protein